ncbi:hypothetical protein ACH5RR_006928 [Cinchona calisaya]|uniref:Uncharacterized protein n=1 Tax=Cinchona calisaya TaxID=153742 RepID=A0ABD3AQB9_9GENT
MHVSQAYYTHSTYQILKVLRPSDWGNDLNRLQSFSGPESQNYPGYSYWDYQGAWFNTFTYQNIENKHSCLFFFKKNKTYSFPIWFNRFWSLIGPNEFILPSPILEGFKFFKSKFSQPNSTMPMTLHFFSKFALPWIFQWRFEFVKNNNQAFPPLLVRQGSIKWWDAYDAGAAHKTQIQNWFSKNPQFLLPLDRETTQFLQQRSTNAILLATAKNKDAYIKQLEDTLSQIKEGTSSSSDKKEVSSKKKTEKKSKKKISKKKKQVSSSSSDSSSAASISTEEDFAQSNEDDCFGIDLSKIEESQL